MFVFLKKREIVSSSLCDEDALIFSSKRILCEKMAGERIRNFWRKRRDVYTHKDDEGKDDKELARELQMFRKCSKTANKRYQVSRSHDTASILRIKGKNVRKASMVSGNHVILKFYLVPHQEKRTFIVELPISVPTCSLPTLEMTEYAFDAEKIWSVEQKGSFLLSDFRLKMWTEGTRITHECSSGVFLTQEGIFSVPKQDIF